MSETQQLELLGQRIDHLEERIAYQDQALTDLNDTITAQWKLIDTLSRKLVLVDEQIRDVQDGAGASGLPEPPPPHY